LPQPIVSNKPVPKDKEQDEAVANAEKVDSDKKQFNFGSTLYLNALEGKALPKVNQRAYKGYLRALADNGKILLVNYVDIEQYLASVLPAKTMVVWPDETIKAQAVAARSYALHQKQRNSKKQYDLTANDKELPYEGTGPRIEKAGITKLIHATAGQYLADATGLPVLALTTSSSGGRTEGAAGALELDYSYLQSVEDYDSDSPDYKWEHRATPALLEGQLAQRGYAVGKLQSVRLSPLDAPDEDRTATGRVRYVILSGSAGTAKITGVELAAIIGLKSTLFDVETGTPPPETLKVPIEDRYGFEVGSKDIDIKVKEDERPVWNKLLRSYHMLGGGKEEKIIFHGRGRGTGLGLSAWGARGMVVASEKTTYRQILEHYYPGTRLVK
ncbi:MAG: SpoIID/LytB domain-containing protein, partial [Phascolarctobacterium sp.]